MLWTSHPSNRQQDRAALEHLLFVQRHPAAVDANPLSLLSFRHRDDAQFVMPGFNEHFGWECPVNAVDCTPTPQSQINLEQSMVAWLFAVGTAIGALFAPYLFNNYGRKPSMLWGALIFTMGALL